MLRLIQTRGCLAEAYLMYLARDSAGSWKSQFLALKLGRECRFLHISSKGPGCWGWRCGQLCMPVN
jgi:hypothetical protein